jgi:hypothetical protein
LLGKGPDLPRQLPYFEKALGRSACHVTTVIRILERAMKLNVATIDRGHGVSIPL